MPKKTAYSRSRAQRSSKPKQKSFELVHPVSDKTVSKTVESSKEIEVADEDEVVSETEGTEEAEERVSGKEEAEEPVSEKEQVQTEKRSGTKESVPSVTIATSSASNAPQSASARFAARRKSVQKEKAQRSGTSLIAAENYTYVRKDLLFILILAILMFSAIILMRFIPAIGG